MTETKKIKRGPTKRLGFPLEDATKALNIPLLQIDIDKAWEVKAEDVNDESNFLTCVLAQSVTRVCGANRVAILRTTAYVAWPGEQVTRRYEISDEARDVVERFDRGEELAEGVEITFTPPTPQRKLGVMRGEWHKNKAKWNKTNRKQRKSDPLHHVVRNGNVVTWS